MLVSVIVWLLERRQTADFGGPPVEGLVCSHQLVGPGDGEGHHLPIAEDAAGRLTGAAWTAARWR